MLSRTNRIDASGEKLSSRDGPEEPYMHSSYMPLGDALITLKRHKFFVSAWLVLWIASGLLYIANSRQEFTASALIILNPSRSANGNGSGVSEGGIPSLDGAQTESQTQVLKSERILNAVFEALNIQNSPDFATQNTSSPGLFRRNERDPSVNELDVDQKRRRIFQQFVDRVSVKRVGQSYVLEVSYQALTPLESAKVANSICMQYLKSQIALKAASIQQGTVYLQGRIQSITSQLSAATDAVKTGIIPDSQFPDADAQVISSASPPLAKSFPKSKLIVAISTTIGVVSLAIFVFIKTMLEKRIKSTNQVKHVLSAKYLGSIKKNRRIRTLAAQAREYFGPSTGRRAGARNGFVDVLIELVTHSTTMNRKVVGIYSWERGEGRTFLSQQLALSFVEIFGDVILIDADVKKPDLTDSLFGDEGIIFSHEEGRPEFILRGQITETNSSFLFVPSTVSKLIFEKASIATIFGSTPLRTSDPPVIIDFPAISTSPDALAISRVVDHAIVVLEFGVTEIDCAQKAITAIRASGVSSIGVVINKTP